MASIQDVLAAASKTKPREAAVRILHDKDLDDELAAANAEFERAAADHGDEITKPEHVVALAKKVEKVAGKVEAAKVEYRFRALGGQAYYDLQSKHPPTKEQREANPLAQTNPDTFRPALIAASCVDPEMTVDEAAQLIAVLSKADFEQLVGTCFALHEAGDTPKSPWAAGLIHLLNGRSAKSATTSKSRGRSSSDES